MSPDNVVRLTPTHARNRMPRKVNFLLEIELECEHSITYTMIGVLVEYRSLRSDIMKMMSLLVQDTTIRKKRKWSNFIDSPLAGNIHGVKETGL